MGAKENQRGRNKNKTLTSKAANLHSKIDYVAIINTSLDGFWVADLQGRFLDVNDSSCRMMGYSREELLAKSIADIEVSETPEETAQHIKKLVKQGYERFETCLRHKDGHTIYCEISAIYSTSGRGCLIFFSRDMTERRQVEAELQKSSAILQQERDKLLTLISSMPDEVWYTDADGRFVLLNEAAAKEFKLPQNGQPIPVLELATSLEVFDIDGKPRQPEEAPPLRALKGETIKDLEEIVRVPFSGELRYRQVSSSPVRDAGNRIVGAVSVVRDVTERKQAEEMLGESEEKLRSIVENSSDQIFMLDKDCRFLAINKAVADLLKKSPKEMIGTLIFEMFPEETADRFSKNIKYVFDTGNSLHLDEKMFVQGHEFFNSTSLNPVKDDKGNVIAVTGIIRDITEHKKIEEALRASEKRYRYYIEVTGGLGWTTNANGEVVEDIPSFRQFTGQSYEEVNGWGWSKALHPDDLENTIQVWKKAVEQKSRYDTEYRLRRYDGIYRYFMARGVPTLDEDGNIREWVGTCIDITERNLVEEALQKSEEKYRTLFESTKEGVIISAPDGTILSANSAAATTLGYDSPQDLVGVLGPELFIDLRQREMAQAALLSNGYTKDMEIELRKKSGTPVNVLGSSIIHRDQQGKPIRVETIWTDISERKMAERKIEQAAEEWRTTFDSIPDLVSIHDKDFRIIRGNRACAKTLGLKLQELTGKHCYDLYHGTATPPDVCPHANVLKTGKTTSIELFDPRLGGHVEVSASPIFDDKGDIAGSVHIVKDINERKRAEQKLQEAFRNETEARREAQEEMKKRADFTRILVHELKTPLTSLVASSGLLASELPEGMLLRIAKNINRSANDLNNRIDELLDVARGELGMLKLSLTLVDPLITLQESAEEMGPAALSRRQSLILDLPSALPSIWADNGRLQQVIRNLLNNAYKFTGEGGIIILKAREEDDKLVVEVEDTGSGITEVEQQSIFDAYYRGEGHKDHVSGLGLGLALCKILVELHRGQIWVRSTLGKGSTFGFSIPMATANQQRGTVEV